MTDRSEFKEKPESRKMAFALLSAAQNICESAKEIQCSYENIILSCQTPGTKGAVSSDQLLEKVNEMKNLVDLCNSLVFRYRCAAVNLVNGISEDEVLPDLLVYYTSVSDQLQTEITGYSSLLATLLKDGVQDT